MKHKSLISWLVICFVLVVFIISYSFLTIHKRDLVVPLVFPITAVSDAPNPVPPWKDIVYNEFKNITEWKQSNLSDWQLTNYTHETQHRNQLKIYGPGKILLLSKSFNRDGCKSDCSAEGKMQDNLVANIKISLSQQNGWTPVLWPTESSSYTDYLYVKEGHPLILQIGERDAVTGGMYVDIEFLY
jgi:hypothetical protein